MKTLENGRKTAGRQSWSPFALAMAAAATLSLSACGNSPPETPEATVQKAAELVTAGEFGGVFELLPPSYQSDLNQIVSTFVGAVPAETWDSGVGLLQEFVALAEAKKDIIMSSPDFPQEAKAQFEPTLKMLSGIVNSSAISHSSLSGGNIGDVLELIGKESFDVLGMIPERDAKEALEGLKMLQKIKAEPVSVEGDKAKVKITMDGQSKDVEFTRVEGHWVPSDLASEWDKEIGQIKQSVSAFVKTDEFQAGVMGAAGGIEMIKTILPKLKAANSMEEMQEALGPLMMMGGGAGPGPGGF